MPYTFISKRLGFREWTDKDLLPFAEMNMDREVMEFFSDIMSKDASEEFVRKIKAMFEAYGYGLYAVDKLDTGEFIGFIGFWHPSIDLGIRPFIEIGWRIRKEFWNKGFASEGAQACLDYGFRQLDFTEVYSLTALVNKKSERIMQKAGMEKIKEFEHPSLEDGHRLKTHVLYRIKKQ